MNIVEKVYAAMFGTKHERDRKRLSPRIELINALEPEIVALSDEELQARIGVIRDRMRADLTELPDEFQARRHFVQQVLDRELVEVFAIVREASKRTVGMRPYDVQLIGGIVLHEGRIAEMKTGEGKTLVATLPVVLNALTGRGVHLITVNDYLARRDADWMGKVYRFLGLTVGCIQNSMGDVERQEAYGADITYGTNNEYGFDYLRDNMKFRIEQMVQRGHIYAIVDEVDSILVDEARTPLIISGPSESSVDLYYRVDKIIPKLEEGEEIEEEDGEKTQTGDYIVDEKGQTSALTDRGVHKAEQLLSVDNLYDPANIDELHAVNQALRAHSLYKNDVNYIVKDGEVLIVDEFTGRLMAGRRWSDGLHQAVEAKEGVKIRSENQTLATVTLQNFFRMYEKLAGMTGTAETEEEEFDKIYGLDVAVIPTNEPIIRDDRADLVYKTMKEKDRAIIEEIIVRHAKQQPMLVGTVSVDRSEHLAKLLKRKGVKHNVLNAKYHEHEAEIVSQAGRPGAVTIATNMAGRGTDIVLGGSAEFVCWKMLEEREVSREDLEAEHFITFVLSGQIDRAREMIATDERLDEGLIAKMTQVREEFKEANQIVIGAGGLCILGTERHESRRIDNQLRGRSGRQGDPGTAVFFLSLEDDLMRIFAKDWVRKAMDKLGMEEDVPIESKMVSKSIANAQTQVEGRNFDTRKHLLEYDDVMNKQREEVYSFRKKVLDGTFGRGWVIETAEQVAMGLIEDHCRVDADPGDWETSAVDHAFFKFFGVTPHEVGIDWESISRPELEELLPAAASKLYSDRLETFDAKQFESLERFVMLDTVDRLWKEHLLALDHLRQGIGLRAYGQRNPLIEYKQESFNLFEGMWEAIEDRVLTFLYHAEPVERDLQHRRSANMTLSRPKTEQLKQMAARRADQNQVANNPVGQTVTTVRRNQPKVGRNDPCPCGSGKKYKKCHGKVGAGV